MRWSADFLKKIGLDDLCRNDFEIIGQRICEPGSAVGEGKRTNTKIALIK